MILEYKINDTKYLNSSVNNVLKSEFNISSRLLTFIVNNKLVFLNNKICDTRICPQLGDLITVSFDYKEDNSNIVPAQMNINIVYEDEWILILNKPSGIAIHPSMLHFSDSLSNGVRYYFDSIGLHKKIRPVNRLDFYTSGLVIFAKCAYIHEQLSMQMQNGSFSKIYTAAIYGKLDKNFGTIDLPIGRKNDSLIERCVDFEHGKSAITNYKVLEYDETTNTSIVECKLITGRTHQIRVHFSSIGHPLVGDSLYGDDISDSGQCLNCSFLEFYHPVYKKIMQFKI